MLHIIELSLVKVFKYDISTSLCRASFYKTPQIKNTVYNSSYKK
jgi:hypothetical protein